MHEEVLEEVKEAMHLHERLNPYIQSLVENSHDNYEPIILPTFYAFEEDEKTYKDSDDFMLGDKLLVCPVVEEGQTERQIYLPKNPEGWVDYYTGDVYEGEERLHWMFRLLIFLSLLKKELPCRCIMMS